MSQFTTHGEFHPEYRNGVWKWILTKPLIWEVRGAINKFDIIVPEGFTTDLGTIPWYGRVIFDPADPQCAKSYILHDYILCEFGPRCQLFAASQLYESLRASDVPMWKRKVITAAVILAIDNW